MAENNIRKVSKLTTFFSAIRFSALSSVPFGLNTKYFNANPKLMDMNIIKITTSQAIRIPFEFHHEN